MIVAVGVEVPEAAFADLCRRYQVKEMSVFGSAARGELRADSDVDFLVEFADDATIDIFDFGHLESELGVLLNRRVDLFSRRGMNPRIAPHILRDVRLLYAA